MQFPFEYDHAEALVFGGALPTRRSFDDATVVILSCPGCLTIFATYSRSSRTEVRLSSPDN